MRDRAEVLLQSPVSHKNTASSFPEWCNHTMLLPVGLGLSLADLPGLGAVFCSHETLAVHSSSSARAALAGVPHTA